MFHRDIRIEKSEMTVYRLIEDGMIVEPDTSIMDGKMLEDFTYYIESLLIGTAVAPFVLGNSPVLKGQGKCIEIVDGKKRYTILKSYVRGDFCLTECRFCKSLSQKSFYDLPRDTQRRIKDTVLTVFSILESGNPEFTQDFYDSICRSIRGEDNYTDVHREEDV